MSIKPILFNTEMVKAIKEGRKTQTRRIIKDNNVCQPFEPGDILWVRETWRPAKGTMHTYIHGEITESEDWHDGYEYRAGGYSFPDGFKESSDYYHLSEIRSGGSWKPSIHMPKEAARIFLRVKDVRIELLRNVFFTDGAAILEVQKEGVDIGETCRTCIEHYGCPCCIDADDDTECVELDNPRYDFSKLWDSTIKPADRDKYGWKANPLVWVIEFERCDKPEGWCRGE